MFNDHSDLPVKKEQVEIDNCVQFELMKIECHSTENFSVCTCDVNDEIEALTRSKQQSNEDCKPIKLVFSDQGNDEENSSSSIANKTENPGNPGSKQMCARSPAEQETISWILDNFQPSDGNSIRRSILFNLYLEHCLNLGIEAMSAPLFGKLIRTTFVGIKTRRLGSRGNSKYHYYGIAVANGSSLKPLIDHQCSHYSHNVLLEKQKIKYDTNNNEETKPKTGERANEENMEFEQFINTYMQYLKNITSAVLIRQFNHVHDINHAFWQPFCLYPEDELDTHISGLTVDQIDRLLGNECVICALKRMEDLTNYTMVHIMIPDLFHMAERKDEISSFVVNFIEQTRSLISSTPTKFQIMKDQCAYHFTTLLDSRFNTADLLKKVKADLSNPSLKLRLLGDFERANWNLSLDTLQWTAEDDPDFIKNVTENIMSFLKDSRSVCDCVNGILNHGFTYAGQFRHDLEDYGRACRTIIRNWNCYSACLMRLFVAHAPDNWPYLRNLLSGIGNCLTTEMTFKRELADTILNEAQLSLFLVQFYSK
ncbi:hypothetical protein ACOME3_001967 [Neoechinorhynchus agilis]